MLLSSKKCLRFGNINPRYLKNKTELFIDHVIDKKMDVCVVTETWMITIALQLLHCLRKATLSAMFPVNLIGLVVVLELSFVTVHVSTSRLSILSKDLHMRFLNGKSLQMDTLQNLSSSIDLLTLKLIRSLPMFSLKNSLHLQG